VRRVIRRVLGGVYLLGGVALTLPLGGCLGFVTKYTLGELRNLERCEAMDVARVSRVELDRDGAGAWRAAVEVVMTDGRVRRFETAPDQLDKREDPALLPWARARPGFFHLGQTDFAPGVPVQPLLADGTVQDSIAALTTEQRADGLLAMFYEGKQGRWFLWFYLPEEAPRAAGVPLLNAGAWLRCPVSPPVTTGSRVAQVGLGIVALPLAFAVDVVTWPIQLGCVLYSLGRINMKC